MIQKEEPKQETLKEVKDLNYWRNNAEEDYLQVPISVLRYISALEMQQEKKLYSEEEVKHIVSEALQSALVKVDLEQWFKQSKKKQDDKQRI